MIGEPELEGEDGGEPPGGSEGKAAAARWWARPWVWALGGIVAASAVWATVLPASGDTAPRLYGYRLGGNPCDGEALKPLTDAVGKQGFAASAAKVSRGPALDELSCVLSGSSPAGDGWVTDCTITVGVELHKKTDPRDEFENARRARVSTVPADASDGSVLVATDSSFLPGTDVHPVTGVGDEAYFVEPSDSDRTLEVLRGGAVLTLKIDGYRSWNGPGDAPDSDDPPELPDLRGLRPAMTEAIRRLMTALAY